MYNCTSIQQCTYICTTIQQFKYLCTTMQQFKYICITIQPYSMLLTQHATYTAIPKYVIISENHEIQDAAIAIASL